MKRLRRIALRWTLPAALAACLTVTGVAALERSIVGVWQKTDEDTGLTEALVTISEADGLFTGVVSRVFTGPGEPAQPICTGCFGAKHNQPIIGMKVVDRMRRAGPDYVDGIITDTESGFEYRGKLVLSPDGKHLSLRPVSGAAEGVRIIEWTRVD